MNFNFDHGWRWRRFSVGFGVEYYNKGIDAWLMLGFWYISVEAW